MTRQRNDIDFKLLEPQRRLYSEAAPYNLCIGAQGSGKSHDIGIRSAMFVIYVPDVIGLIAANTYDQLSRATLLAVFKVWKDVFGWVEYDAKARPHGHYVIGREPPPHFKPHGYTLTSNNNNIYLANGAVIFSASLENYKSIEGVEIGWALLDETADTREDALTSVITGRLRQKGLSECIGGHSDLFPYCKTGSEFAGKAINPLFIYTKPAKVPWLKDLFKLDDHHDEIISRIYSDTDYFYHFDGIRQVVIYSVLHNRCNLPEDYIENRISFLQGSGLIDSHIYGNPFSKSGGEFVPEFSKIKHIGNCQFDTDLPIHLSVDFNAKPYMTGLVCQLAQIDEMIDGQQYDMELRILDEYALESPRNTAGHLAEAFCEDYGDLAGFGLYIYGDASGNNSIPVRGVKSYFEDLTNSITVNYELRVPDQNPRYKAALGQGSMGRKAFINVIFSGKKNVKVVVSPKCKHVIADLEFCQEDENGKLQKKKNKDGVEELGHHLDSIQYLICHPKFLGYLAKM